MTLENKKTMKKMTNLGWIAAGVLAGVMIFSGFGQSQEKLGIVDTNRLATTSKMGLRNTENLRAALTSRDALMTYMNENPTLTEEQATRLRALATKTPMTEAEKTEETTIKKAIADDRKVFDDLNKKNPPTDAERQKLSEFNKRRSDTQIRLAKWQNEFQAELQQLQNDVRTAESKNVKEVLTEIAKKGGYTVVLEQQIAPYGANDITDECIKALDAKTN